MTDASDVEVHITVSREVYDELRADWSKPLQLRIERRGGQDEFILRDIGHPIEAYFQAPAEDEVAIITFTDKWRPSLDQFAALSTALRSKTNERYIVVSDPDYLRITVAKRDRLTMADG